MEDRVKDQNQRVLVCPKLLVSNIRQNADIAWQNKDEEEE